jgi:hypothetical protein
MENKSAEKTQSTTEPEPEENKVIFYLNYRQNLAAAKISETTKLNIMIRFGGTFGRKPKSSEGDVSAKSDLKKSGIVF